MNMLLGVDIGTSGLKTTLVGEDGVVMGSASEELQTSMPYHGWTEQDPEDWYQALRRTLKNTLNSSGSSADKITAIGVDAAAHTPVLLDEDFKVLRPAILWTDLRSVNQVEHLREHHGERIFEIGYQDVNPTWTLPQLMWVKENEPEVIKATRMLMIAKDYLRFRLTGTWETDYIDALSTLMLDAKKRAWSKELLDFIGWPMETMPEIVAPTDVVGEVTPDAARDTGLVEGTPVIAGTSDSSVEAYAAGQIKPGQCIIKLATAANANLMTDKPHPSHTTFTYYHVIPGNWYTVAGTNSCATSLRWYRDVFGHEEVEKGKKEGIDPFRLIDDQAETVEPGSEGLIFHPYLLGERSPHWDPYLRADFLGFTMRHQKRHFARSVLEGVGFSIRDCLEAVLELGLEATDIRIIGGGSKSPLWRKIVADVLNLEVMKPMESDASYGVALLSGVGTGTFDSLEGAIEQCVKITEVISPNKENAVKYDRLFKVYKEAHGQMKEIYHTLSKMQ